MYFITYGTRYLFDPRIGLTLPSARLQTEVNTAGVLEFSIAATHELYEVIKEHDVKNPIVVYDNDVVKFRGTITAIKQDFFLTKSVVCRGELAYLNDTLVRPYSTVVGEVSRTAPSTVDGYFRFLIAEHNSQADAEKRFSIARNQGADLDANNYLYRSDTLYPTVGETIKEKLLNTIGGYLQLDYSKQTPHLSYLADFSKANAQVIDFGVNLLDYTSEDDASGIATYIIPVGKTVEKEKGDSNIDVQAERLTIKGEPNKTLEAGYIKSGDIIYSARGVEKFGWIGACVEYDDVSAAANLVSKGLKTLKTLEMPAVTIEISAIDLAIIKPEHEPMATEQYVRVRSRVHDFDSYLLCTKLEYDLNNPENNVITLGTTQDSLTNKHIRSLNAMVNTVYEAADRISAEAKAAAVIAGLAQDSIQEVQTVSKEAAQAAQAAQEKAEAAIDQSNAAAEAAAATEKAAAEAKEAAREAEKEAQEAQAKAEAAAKSAEQLKQNVTAVDEAAKAAATAASLAQDQAAQANEAAASATNAAQAAQEDIAAANESIAATKASVEAADAEIADVKGRLETTTTTMEATAQSVQDLASEQETMKSSLTQNAAQLSSTVESVTLLQTDLGTAQADIQAAQSQAEAAAAGASEAIAAATQAQSAADSAAKAATDAEANAIAAAAVYADNIQETLQGQIDGAIETWSGSVAPSDTNPPANAWTDTNAKKKHIGDLYYDTLTGYAYRYSTNYTWSLIKDTDVTKAIADASAAQTAAEAAQNTADTAKTTAAAAQTAATNAMSAAASAQAGIDGLTPRVSTAETEIKQNANDISLRATKTEAQEYATSKADAALASAKTFTTSQGYLTVSSDKITSMVRATETAQATADAKTDKPTATAEGTCITVTNAASAPLLGIKVYGAYTQDGTPTLDKPAPVEFIAGSIDLVSDRGARNLLTDNTSSWEYGNGIKAITNRLCLKNLQLPAGDYVFTTSEDYFALNVYIVGIGYVCPDNMASELHFTLESDGLCHVVLSNRSLGMTLHKTDVTDAKPKLEEGSTATVWVPALEDADSSAAIYTVDLQGHELAELPNGVKDTLEVDAEFNLTLVQRIGKAVLKGGEVWSASIIETGDKYRFDSQALGGKIDDSNPSDELSLLSSTLPTVTADETYRGIEGIGQSGKSLYVYSDKYATGSPLAWKSFLAANPLTLYYELAKPVAIDLGAIEMPALRAGSNTIYTLHAHVPVLAIEYWTKDMQVVADEKERVDTLASRVITAETAIEQNATDITLRATKTEAQGYAATAKTEAVDEAADDATAKANAALVSAKSFTTSQGYLTVSSDKITSIVSETTRAQNAAEKAQQTADGIQIGGRNIFRQTATGNVYENNWEYDSFDRETRTFLYQFAGQGEYASVQYQGDHKLTTDEYTISMWVKVSSNIDYLEIYFAYGRDSYQQKHVVITDYQDWNRVVWTFSLSDYVYDEHNPTIYLEIAADSVDENEATIEVREPKLEKGNKATDWTPAPEEMATQEAVDGLTAQVSSAESSITQLSNSITAEVAARTDTDKRVSSVELTASSFEVSLQRTENEVSSLGTSIETVADRAEYASRVATDFMGFKEGALTIGTSESEVLLRLTNQLLAFSVNGSTDPVAYLGLSKEIWKLFIENAEITETLNIGGFSWIRRDNGNMSLKWVK